MNAVVLGSGAWGTALALLLFRAGHRVTLWHRDPEKAAKIEELLERVEAGARLLGISEDADLHDLWVLSEECRLAVFAPEVPLKIRNPLAKLP